MADQETQITTAKPQQQQQTPALGEPSPSTQALLTKLLHLASFAFPGISLLSSSSSDNSSSNSGARLLVLTVIAGYLFKSLFSTASTGLSGLQGFIGDFLTQQFVKTAEFREGDEPFLWINTYLAIKGHTKLPASFEVAVKRRYWEPRWWRSSNDDDEDEEERSKQVTFRPLSKTNFLMWYKGRPMIVNRAGSERWWEVIEEKITITMLSTHHDTIRSLVSEAKDLYEEGISNRVVTYTASANNSGWKSLSSRLERPMSSIIMPQTRKDTLCEDLNEFLCSKKWYQSRGIPWRRGWLLHGVPGAGKSSLVFALASEFNLPIYNVTLAKKGLDDSTLLELLSDTKSPSIILIEDIDCAKNRKSTPKSSKKIKKAKSEDDDGDEEETATEGTEESERDTSSVSLSGLLNAIDGVAAPEGRLLFCTTNHVEKIDEALHRPGRLDIWLEFKSATRNDCIQMFKRFYPASNQTADVTLKPAQKLKLTGSIIPYKTKETQRKLLQAAWVEKTYELSEYQSDHLAKEFASKIPIDEEDRTTFSLAEIQGWLLRYKGDPRGATAAVERLVIEENEKKAIKKAAEEEALRKAAEAAEEAKVAAKEAEEKAKKDKEEKALKKVNGIVDEDKEKEKLEKEEEEKKKEDE